MFKSRPINPFGDPPDLWENYLKWRFEKTVKFIGKKVKPPVLDMGYPNLFGQKLSKYYNVIPQNTAGDLNYDGWLNFLPMLNFNTIFMFEVIEHILNPALLLVNIKNICNENARIFITYPRSNSLFWTDGHFHEYDKRRFAYLVEYCGLEIVRHQWFWLRMPIRFYLMPGIRPMFFRWWIGRHRLQLYELKKRSKK